MHPLANWKIAALAALMTAATVVAAPEAGMEDAEGPNVRITRHSDGSTTRFTRTPDNTVLTKRKTGPNGNLTMMTIYKMDKHGNPIGCKIYDGQENLLFKVQYGYRKSDGQLVEERMFDVRNKPIDPQTGKEMPVQRVLYVYDAEGNRSAPMVFNLMKGRSLEDIMGEKSSIDEPNPFDNKPLGTANPNARPLAPEKEEKDPFVR